MSGGIFDPERQQDELKELYAKRESPGFWSDRRAAQEVIDQITIREKPLAALRELEQSLEDAVVLLELAEQEEDESALSEVAMNLDDLERKLSDFEFQTMLGAPDDPKNTFLSINAGAGGTESQDWVSMLLRMYVRFIERKGFTYEEMDLQPGQEAGIKSVTILVKGDYAYGYLKAHSMRTRAVIPPSPRSPPSPKSRRPRRLKLTRST
jgi:peptide chain release factor 2